LTDDVLTLHSDDGLVFSTNGQTVNERMRILSNGNVGIGTSSPSEQLDVVGDAKISAKLFIGPNPTNYGNVALQVGNTADSNVYAAEFRTNNTSGLPTVRIENLAGGNALEILNGQAYKPGGGSWGVASDERLKQDITEYNEGLNEVRSIRTVTYRYNEKSGHNTDITYVGIIAQELERIAPHMVKQKNEYLSVDPSAFTYMLINAVQEQDQIITDQQKEIDELKARLDRIEALLKK
jgi:hypothetical protein